MQKGVLPAVELGRSVSRVGGKAQLPVYRAIAGELKLAYAQFEELETFARFGARLDERTRATLERGRRVRELLRQEANSPLTAHRLRASRAVISRHSWAVRSAAIRANRGGYASVARLPTPTSGFSVAKCDY